MKARVTRKGEARDSIQLSFSFRCLASYLATFDSNIVFEKIKLTLYIGTAFWYLENVVLMLHSKIFETSLMLHIQLILTLSYFFD